jgi:hypothetical protein
MSSVYRPTDLEKENLEAHVELSMERFNHLDSRVHMLERDRDTMEHSVGDLERTFNKTIEQLNKDMNRMIIGAAFAIITGLSSAVFTFLTTK